MGDSPSASTEMIWRMKKTDPMPWRKMRENLWEPEAISLLAKPSATGGWLPRLFLSPPLALSQRALRWWFQGALSLGRILRLGFALKAGGVEKERGRERGILGLASVKGRGRGGERRGEMSSQLRMGRGFLQPTLQGSVHREPVWKVPLPCQ